MRYFQFVPAGAAVFAATMAFTGSASAATVVYSNPTPLVGNQNFGGELGIDFTVNKAVRVSQLGAFTNGESPISVTIYNLAGDVVVASETIALAPVVGDYAFSTLGAPVVLAPGDYQIAANGYNGSNELFNPDGGSLAGTTATSPIVFNSLFGALTSTGAYYNLTPGSAATTFDTGTPNYGAGTFVASVPEPATWAMMLLGFIGLGAAMRYTRATRRTLATA
jgi:hypothetical protein